MALANNVGGWFGRVLGDLAECGYDAEWENIPASALGAPHRRERVWIVAYPEKVVSEPANRRGAGASPAYETRRPSVRSRRTPDVADAKEDGRTQRGAWHEGRNLIATASKRVGAEPAGNGSDGNPQVMADPSEIRQPRSRESVLALCAAAQADRQAVGAISGGIGSIWRSEPDVGRVANGVPKRVDRLGGLGNAVVPQIPELIGNAILASEAAA
ncbi:DNA cytosine methyltransferase [Tateyamaria sp.]|uniref:DNA cytosine methyltransferase n=1 Tax=Roseobacteraceae TaxID=2854170 RepID=UPI0039B87FC9